MVTGFILYYFAPLSLLNSIDSRGKFIRIDTRFATKAYVKNHFGKTVDWVDAAVMDKKDVETLKSILAGYAIEDGTACMFDSDVSVTLTNGQKSITFCPDFLDGEPVIWIDDTYKYRHLSVYNNQKLYRILNKYGMGIPFTKE